jgi:serine/threonine protein kinase
MQLVAGALVAERFRLVRPLGQGGMGSVWLAQDVSLETPCAVKFIHGEAAESAEARARFEREAKSAAQLRSPNVVTILAHGVSEGTPYIAMEYLEGEDLEHRIERAGRLSPQQTLGIMAQVAKALARAHAASLVHRDLKPANIFIVPDEGGELVKVLDFGVAKSNLAGAGGGNTKTGAMVGTPFYMSPEQARGTKAIDHRSDLWALAVIIFRRMTVQLPFVSDALGDLLVQIITDPVPVPSRVAPGLPASFDAWWARASMRDPAQRYPSARELVDAFALSFGLTQSSAASSAVERPSSGEWLPMGAGVAASGPVAGTPNPGAWPSSPDAQARGVSSPGFVPSAATVALSSSSPAGMSTSSAAGPAPRSGRAGLVLAVGSVVALLCGSLVVALVFRGASPGPSTGGTASVAPPPPSAVVQEPRSPTSPSASTSSAPPPASVVPVPLPPSPSGEVPVAPAPRPLPGTGRPASGATRKPKTTTDPSNQM